MDDFNPFKFDGRIGRLQFFGYGVIWGVILFVVFLIGGSKGGAGLYFVAMVVFTVATFSYGIRRLHDFGKNGWWYLLMFVPYANVVFAFVLLLAPGSQGANAYGVRAR